MLQTLKHLQLDGRHPHLDNTHLQVENLLKQQRLRLLHLARVLVRQQLNHSLSDIIMKHLINLHLLADRIQKLKVNNLLSLEIMLKQMVDLH